jgi:hypothetical protein
VEYNWRGGLNVKRFRSRWMSVRLHVEKEQYFIILTLRWAWGDGHPQTWLPQPVSWNPSGPTQRQAKLGPEQDNTVIIMYHIHQREKKKRLDIIGGTTETNRDDERGPRTSRDHSRITSCLVQSHCVKVVVPFRLGVCVHVDVRDKPNGQKRFGKCHTHPSRNSFAARRKELVKRKCE